MNNILGKPELVSRKYTEQKKNSPIHNNQYNEYYGKKKWLKQWMDVGKLKHLQISYDNVTYLCCQLTK